MTIALAIPAKGPTDLQQAYEASLGSVATIGLTTTRGAVRIEGAALAPGAILFEVHDGANILIHATKDHVELGKEILFNGPTVADRHVHFETDLTIGVEGAQDALELDDVSGGARIRLLPNDITITAFFNKIETPSTATYTLDFVNATFGAFLAHSATMQYNQSGGPFGSGLVVNHQARYQPGPGVTFIGPIFTFVHQPRLTANGNVGMVFSQAIDFLSQATVAGDGGDATLSLETQFLAGGAIATGGAITTRRAYYARDKTTSGVTGTQTALYIDAWGNAGTNIGVRSAIAAAGGNLFLDHSGGAPSEHLGTFRIGGRLEHLGDADTYVAFTPNLIELIAGSTPTLRANATGIAFQGGTPAAKPTLYSITGDAANARTFDPTTVTLQGLADVVATPLGDLGVASSATAQNYDLLQ